MAQLGPDSAISLMVALGARDPDLGVHSRAVAHLTQRVAGRLGFKDARLAYLSGLLHDVGKVGIPDVVLSKDGPLTIPEWELMTTHCELGAQILAPMTWAFPLLDVVRAHHENFDGSGYPYKRKGREIPFLARVLRVTDSYEAMTNDRVYRAALSPSAALDELQRFGGTHFDPRIVDAFSRVMTETVISLEPELTA